MEKQKSGSACNPFHVLSLFKSPRVEECQCLFYCESLSLHSAKVCNRERDNFVGENKCPSLSSTLFSRHQFRSQALHLHPQHFFKSLHQHHRLLHFLDSALMTLILLRLDSFCSVPGERCYFVSCQSCMKYY